MFTMYTFKLKYLVVLIILKSILINEAARILAVFPTPSISHQVVYRPLTQELAKRGHEVVVITTDPAFPKGQTPSNLTEIDVHDISYNFWQEFLATVTGNKVDIQEQFKIGFDFITKIFIKQMRTSEVQHILNDKNQKFDLLFIEAWVRPALVISHVYKAPVILVSSFGAMFENNEFFGTPVHPILYPSNLQQHIYNHSVWDKITELYNHYRMIDFVFNKLREDKNEMLRTENIDPNVSALSELNNNVNMLFLNIHPIWEGNYPVPPAVVYMGDLHQTPEKHLPEDLQKYLDSSKNGVIYVSFGTNVKPSFLQSEKIEVLLKVFSELPYDILWKWDMDELPGRTENIRIFKWLPQSDLLRHPKIKLFITQAGLQSTEEAINAGVPLIGIPIITDQWFNAEKYTFLGIGLKLEMETLTEAKFKYAIESVISDESYRRNIAKLSALMRDQPQSALERAVWWTEHVLRHGGAKHLRAPAANISWTQYSELELAIIVFGILIVVITFIFSAIFYLKIIFLN